MLCVRVSEKNKEEVNRKRGEVISREKRAYLMRKDKKSNQKRRRRKGEGNAWVRRESMLGEGGGGGQK